MNKINIIIISLLITSCSLFSREFEINKISVDQKDENLSIEFYTTENITELNKDRLIQFRCNFEDSDQIIFGDIYIDRNSLFIFKSGDLMQRNTKPGSIKANVAKDIKGYRYTAIIDKSNLKNINEMTCYVIGVTMAPLPFPRSNSIVITNKEIEKFNKSSKGTQ